MLRRIRWWQSLTSGSTGRPERASGPKVDAWDGQVSAAWRTTRVVMAIAGLVPFAASASVGGDSRLSLPSSVQDTIVRVAGPPLRDGVAQLVPEITIGTVNGPAEYALSAVSSLLVRRDGHIFVMEFDVMRRAGPAVREYDASGRFVRMIGGRGEGPGEYRGIFGFALLEDDRLIVLTVGRINVYSPEGEPVATWPVFAYPPAGIGRALQMTRDEILHLGYARRRPTRDDEVLPMGIVRMRAGAVLDTVFAPELPDVSLPAFPVWTRSPEPSMWGTPYSPEAAWLFSPLNSVITYRTDRYALDVHATAPLQDGVLRAGPRELLAPGRVVSIRRNVPPVEVSAAERRDQRAFLEQSIPQGARHGAITEIPRVKPRIRGAVVDEEGRIWVWVSMPSERYDPPLVSSPDGRMRPDVPWREPNVWDVFQPEGTYIGRVRMPYGVFPYVMRGDHVWGRWHDESDVPFVTRYRIVWSEP